MCLVFGTGGVPLSTPEKGSVAGIRQVAKLGLGCMELEFVHGVQMKRETATQVAATAQKLGIRLTVHAPYYINLSSSDPDKVVASRKRLLAAARVGHWCGAESVAFHAGFYGGDWERCRKQIKEELLRVQEILTKEDNPITIRPETMGKPSQFGTLAEIYALSKEIPGILPVVDFSHLHAREGKSNTRAEFEEILTTMEKELGPASLKNIHAHISGIAYGEKGEKKHLPLLESDLDFQTLLQVLKEKEASGLIICESPNLEEDALLLQKTYAALT